MVLAVAWAGYLIPKALQHHDEVARTRSIDRFSTAMRVLARREPVSGSGGARRGQLSARLVVTPARSADNPRVLPPPARRNDEPAPESAQASVPSGFGTTAEAASGESQSSVRRTVRPGERRAARVAARRRRRILLLLLIAVAAVGALGYLGYLREWAPAVPGGLTVCWLLLCRRQVRRERQRAWSRELDAVVQEADLSEPVEPREVLLNAQGFEELDPLEDTITIPAEELAAVVVPTSDGGALWDPLPITLPTYVAKSTATRTVSTIDLSAPGTWTSGRVEEDAELVERAAAETESTQEPPAEAVGS